jgi:hypothetical protein
MVSSSQHPTLHIYGLIETQNAIAPQISIYTIWRRAMFRLRDRELRLTAAVFGRICDVRDEHEAGRFD